MVITMIVRPLTLSLLLAVSLLTALAGCQPTSVLNNQQLIMTGS
jgi:hypothetical protein